MKIVIKKLLWDDWNLDHIKKHRVIVTEVEDSLKDPFVVFITGHTHRLMSLGRSGKRLITTVLQEQRKHQYYIVTARDMAIKERAIYREEKQKKEEEYEKN